MNFPHTQIPSLPPKAGIFLFRGNMLAYAKRVGEIMKQDDDENVIYKQFRGHLQQFNAAWERYKEREGL